MGVGRPAGTGTILRWLASAGSPINRPAAPLSGPPVRGSHDGREVWSAWGHEVDGQADVGHSDAAYKPVNRYVHRFDWDFIN